MALAILCGTGLIIGIAIGYALAVTIKEEREKTGNTQININIVQIDNRDERHYTLRGCELPKAIYRGNSVALIPNSPHRSATFIEGREEMNLLQASLNDIAKVDKWA
ncbi:MAG: hypothetical protein V1661_02605 [bacterium]